MAIYHLNMKIGSRDGGQSARAKYEYIAREGKYANGRVETQYISSSNMPSWVKNPIDYWRAADEYERSNGRLYRQVEFALPVELSKEEQKMTAIKFAEILTEKEHLPYTLSIHSDDKKNPHCHLIISERINDGIDRPMELWFRRSNPKSPEQGGAKKTESMKPKEWLLNTRAAWADMANAALEHSGIEERIDHRSLAAQGITDREAQIHEGRSPEKKTENRTIKTRNIRRAEINLKIDILEKELASINESQSIIQKEREALAEAEKKRKAQEEKEISAKVEPKKGQATQALEVGQVQAAPMGAALHEASMVTKQSQKSDANITPQVGSVHLEAVSPSVPPFDPEEPDTQREKNTQAPMGAATENPMTRMKAKKIINSSAHKIYQELLSQYQKSVADRLEEHQKILKDYGQAYQKYQNKDKPPRKGWFEGGAAYKKRVDEWEKERDSVINNYDNAIEAIKRLENADEIAKKEDEIWKKAVVIATYENHKVYSVLLEASQEVEAKERVVLESVVSPLFSSSSLEDGKALSSVEVNQELIFTKKEHNQDGKRTSFRGEVVAIDASAGYFNLRVGTKNLKLTDKAFAFYDIREVPYEQTRKCAYGEIAKLREQGLVSPGNETSELRNHEKYTNGNICLLGETGAYAILGIVNKGMAPLIASLASLGPENMEKLRATQTNGETVKLEKTNGKITVQTPREIAQREQNRGRGGIER